MNGKLPSADDAKYADRKTRGDVIGWFDSGQEEWPHGRGLEGYLLKLGTLVSELQATVPELSKITSRSKAMVACYPGGGARYVKHVDNDGKHALCKTRLLTALIYLNDGWEDGDGGELAIFRAEDENAVRRVVAPVANRVLLFWSDWRTPHEVRPSEKLRYSVTLWLLDNTKKGPDEQQGYQETPQPQPSQLLQPPPPQTDEDAGLAEITCPDVQHEWSLRPELWELKVLFQSDPAECPALELSDALVRLLRAGVSILCLPLPAGASGAPLSKWSKKKRTLTIQFQRDAVPASPSQNPHPGFANFVEQLTSQGWGVIDGFLPGPEADELRSYVLQQRASGKLKTGKNSHEGPIRALEDGEKNPMKNDEYTFCDSEHLDAPCLRELTRRCNQLLAKLMVGSCEGGPNLTELQRTSAGLWEILLYSLFFLVLGLKGSYLEEYFSEGFIRAILGTNLLQGHPMMAVYPGNGSAYGRHLDSTAGGRGANGRVLTLVLHLSS